MTRLVNFREKHLQNMKYNDLTTIYESIFAQMYTFSGRKYIFPIFVYGSFMVKINNCKFYEKYVHLGQTAFTYCSWITVVLVQANIFI